MPNWFLVPVRPRAPTMRLFCLPYAGGSAAVFRTWAGLLPAGVELFAAQLPGRGWRLRESPLTDLALLADELAAAIAPEAELPFAIFGHSMGAWVGLEVVRRLEAMGLRPQWLMASGRQAPSLGCTQPRTLHLDDEAFVAAVQSRYGGIPEELLRERELLQLLLPGLRADFELLETYEHHPPYPVRTPIHALAGAADRVVAMADLAPWRQETSGGFEIRSMPGGHFYFQPDPSALMEVLRPLVGAGVAAAGANPTASAS